MTTWAAEEFTGAARGDDARAIWTAVQQPKIKAVAVKSEAPQAILALHRMRQPLVTRRSTACGGY
jgi:transposase